MALFLSGCETGSSRGGCGTGSPGGGGAGAGESPGSSGRCEIGDDDQEVWDDPATDVSVVTSKELPPPSGGLQEGVRQGRDFPGPPRYPLPGCTWGRGGGGIRGTDSLIEQCVTSFLGWGLDTCRPLGRFNCLHHPCIHALSRTSTR